jgi:hypothetical protein
MSELSDTSDARVAITFQSAANPPPDAASEAGVSFNFSAHSLQHTSTVLPPIWTLKEVGSSSQSQAAHVFSDITFLPLVDPSCAHFRNARVRRKTNLALERPP